MFTSSKDTTKVDKIGKIYIKKQFRNLLDVGAGDKVELLVDKDNQELLIRPVINKEQFL